MMIQWRVYVTTFSGQREPIDGVLMIIVVKLTYVGHHWLHQAWTRNTVLATPKSSDYDCLLRISAGEAVYNVSS